LDSVVAWDLAAVSGLLWALDLAAAWVLAWALGWVWLDVSAVVWDMT
jgi:hypothetical protein